MLACPELVMLPLCISGTEPLPPWEVYVKERGSHFKSSIITVEYEPEGVMYTVRHITDGYTH
jgi:hypothetical protein